MRISLSVIVVGLCVSSSVYAENANPLGNTDVGSVNISEAMKTLPQGKWKAVSEEAVKNGASFDDSLMSMEVKGSNLLLSSRKSSSCNESYTVKYESTYIMTKEEREKSPWKSGPKDCGIIKQGKTSSLAKFAFCKKDAESYEMILGEGMPMLLANFHPSHKQDLLLREYEKTKKELAKNKPGSTLEPGKNDNALIDVNLNQAQAILKSGDVSQKAKTLEDLSHNLWTAKPQTIEKRMKLIEMGMQDKDEAVQMNALRSFDLGGRFPNTIQPMKTWMEGFSSKNPQLQKQALGVLSVLLYEAEKKVSPEINLKNKYGTSQPREILNATGGVIDQQDNDDFLDVCRSLTEKGVKSFSKKDYEDVKQMLLNVAKDKTSSPEIVKMVQQILKENALPRESSSNKTNPNKSVQ